MAWTKNGTPICNHCCRFCIPADTAQPFGGTGPEGLDPYDPEFYCKDCTKWLADKWDSHFKKGGRSGDHGKCNAETEAAKKNGLVWVHSSGLVDLRTERDILYGYILETELGYYEPYLDWHAKHPRHNFNLRESKDCLRCGADWKTGHTTGTEYCHQVTRKEQHARQD